LFNDTEKRRSCQYSPFGKGGERGILWIDIFQKNLPSPLFSEEGFSNTSLFVVHPQIIYEYYFETANIITPFKRLAITGSRLLSPDRPQDNGLCFDFVSPHFILHFPASAFDMQTAELATIVTQ
jgi:hypothetical protein